MEIQRLRNLTTGILHTKLADVYEDIGYLTGEPGIMTHQIPRAFSALQPYLQAVVRDPRFWDGAHDPTHTGEIEVAPMPDDEKKEFFARFGALTETQNDR